MISIKQTSRAVRPVPDDLKQHRNRWIGERERGREKRWSFSGLPSQPQFFRTGIPTILAVLACALVESPLPPGDDVVVQRHMLWAYRRSEGCSRSPPSRYSSVPEWEVLWFSAKRMVSAKMGTGYLVTHVKSLSSHHDVEVA
jgi:hypothetical protein